MACYNIGFDHLTANFQTVEIEFRLYLSIMVTNTEGGKSFSKLTKIKDTAKVKRTSGTQYRIGYYEGNSSRWEERCHNFHWKVINY